MGLAGPGRAVTPVGTATGSDGRGASRSMNGVSDVERDVKDDVKMSNSSSSSSSTTIAGPGVPPTASSGVVLPPPSKMSVPQMVDGP